MENHVQYICRHWRTCHLAPAFLWGISAIGLPVQLLMRTIWSARKKVTKMGAWTKDVFLDSERIHNPTEVTCFRRKWTPLLLLHLQEFITESVFSYWRSSSVPSWPWNSKGRLRRGWNLIVSKIWESLAGGFYVGKIIDKDRTSDLVIGDETTPVSSGVRFHGVLWLGKL